MVGNGRPTQSAAAEASSIDAASAGAGGDWRPQLQSEAREWIVNKIMETLKRHLPISVPEGINELREIAIWCEEKIYTDATTQSDYLRKISLKMLSMETKNPPAAPINPGMPNPAVVNQNPTEPGSIVMQSQPNNPGQPLPVPNRQPILRQNLQNNTSDAVQGSSGMAHTLPPILGLGQSNISGVTHTSNLRNMSGISQSSVNNSIAQGAQPDIYANSQRQLPGRLQQQQIISQQQQQQQSQNLLLYHQQQLQQQLLNRKLQHSSLLQHLPPLQQQQSLLQPNQMQSTRVSLMQISSSLQQNQSNIQQTQPASTQTVSQPGLKQNQLNQIQQSVPSLLQNPSISRQQQDQSLHQQASSAQQQSTPIPQQSILSHQQQMMGQQGNMLNMQQNQLLGQQNHMSDIQQQQQRLPIQQNNLLSMQHQQLMNQQTLNLQQQQLGSLSNMSGLQYQQQLLGSLPSVSNMQPHQLALMKQKNAAQQQQQYQQQQSPLLLHSQGPESQNPSSQQQLVPQYQSQPSHLHQQLLMQQQSNSLQREMQQRLQNSGPILQTQNAMEQKPFIQVPTSSVESTAQTGHAGAIDWQEECYQKAKSMKELHFAELTEFHQKITLKLQQQEALIPPGKQSEQHEKLKGFRQMLERMLALLQINKNNIPVGLKEKLPLYEKQILSMVASNRARKTSPQVQGQQQFQHPNAAGKAQTIPQQQQSQSMEVSEPASFQAVQEEPTFSCPICMCALISPFTTVCGHIFCEGCIKAATKKQKKCPTCRSKLTGRNHIHRVFLPTSD